MRKDEERKDKKKVCRSVPVVPPFTLARPRDRGDSAQRSTRRLSQANYH